MLCNGCGIREATAKIENASGEKLYLCRDCFMRQSSNLLFENYMPSFNRAVSKTPICQHCGTSGDDFLKTAFLGCAKCYEQLSGLVLPYAKKTQPSLTHKGKYPGMDTPASRYNRLKREFDKAVEENRHDDAARIRQAINKLREDENA